MSRITDPSPHTGTYEGDLRYGRAFGTQPNKHKDFSADRINGVSQNVPVVPLTLVQPRDPACWKKDPKVKEIKKELDNSQHGVNYVIQSYQHFAQHMRANIHITVGKQRL